MVNRSSAGISAVRNIDTHDNINTQTNSEITGVNNADACFITGRKINIKPATQSFRKPWVRCHAIRSIFNLKISRYELNHSPFKCKNDFNLLNRRQKGWQLQRLLMTYDLTNQGAKKTEIANLLIELLASNKDMIIPDWENKTLKESLIGLGIISEIVVPLKQALPDAGVNISPEPEISPEIQVAPAPVLPAPSQIERRHIWENLTADEVMDLTPAEIKIDDQIGLDFSLRHGETMRGLYHRLVREQLEQSRQSAFDKGLIALNIKNKLNMCSQQNDLITDNDRFDLNLKLNRYIAEARLPNYILIKNDDLSYWMLLNGNYYTLNELKELNDVDGANIANLICQRFNYLQQQLTQSGSDSQASAALTSELTMLRYIAKLWSDHLIWVNDGAHTELQKQIITKCMAVQLNVTQLPLDTRRVATPFIYVQPKDFNPNNPQHCFDPSLFDRTRPAIINITELSAAQALYYALAIIEHYYDFYLHENAGRDIAQRSCCSLLQRLIQSFSDGLEGYACEKEFIQQSLELMENEITRYQANHHMAANLVKENVVDAMVKPNHTLSAHAYCYQIDPQKIPIALLQFRNEIEEQFYATADLYQQDPNELSPFQSFIFAEMLINKIDELNQQSDFQNKARLVASLLKIREKMIGNLVSRLPAHQKAIFAVMEYYHTLVETRRAQKAVRADQQ